MSIGHLGAGALDLERVKAAILCGGRGSRLRPLTYYFQKSMIPIGRREKPLLEYIVRLIAHHGIRRIAMLVGYKAEQIINYFDDGARFGVEIAYVRDRADGRGNGWALLNAYEKGAIDRDELLLIYYGDILSDIDLTRMIEEHVGTGADATLALASGYKMPVGVAKVEEGEVKALEEKPEIGIHVTIGVALINGALLEDLRALGERRGSLDIMGDFMPKLIKEGKRVRAYIHNGFWYDLTSMERYEKLDHMALEERLGRILD